MVLAKTLSKPMVHTFLHIYNVCAVESAEVIGGDDCIIIRGVADARVTIVSMDGRSQQQMVNGDTRINVRAGVYGVILEQGKAVIREKIVVR